MRVTYNDAKRLQFLADLGNPDIPLTRLMRNPVPHGFKGIDLLDTMFAPPQPAARPGAPAAAGRPPPEPIPVDRALWFIRVLGANEISAHRGRAQPVLSSVQAPSPVAATPSSTATAAPAPATAPMNSNDWYTVEFTIAFTAWIRIQLGQLVLPTKPKAVATTGPTPVKAPTGVLGDEKSRARWLAKWQYSNTLLRLLYRKRLISPRVLIGWLADFLAVANFAQLGFVTQLIHKHLTDLTEYVAIGRHCLRAACTKIEEIRASPTRDTMAKVEQLLTSIVRALYKADPEVLLSPTTWSRHWALVGSLVDSSTATFADLGRRNEALVFRPVLVDSGTTPRRQQVAEISKLDSISAETDMTALCKAFFSGPCAPTSPKIDVDKLEEKVGILVNWAMGLYQLGIHRPYAVYTMLKKWLEWYEETRPNDHFDFFPILYKWLDTSPAAQSAQNVLAIGISFGELTRQGLFSYGRYLNTLIARGHSARNNGGAPSHHLDLLRAMPIFVEARDLLEQRRMVLSGDGEGRDRDQADEDGALEQFREELREYVPEIFGLKRYGRSAMMRESIDYQIPSAAGISRFEFVHTRFWFSAAAVHSFKRRGNNPPMNASTYARVMNICMQCRGYSTLADFLVRGITGTEDEEILLVILDSIKRDADVWTSIDRWNQITVALMDRFRVMLRKGRFLSQLAVVLLSLVQHGRLPPGAAQEVSEATEQHRSKSPQAPAFTVEIDQSMDGLKQVIAGGHVDRGTALAPKLFARHGKFTIWSATWWQTIIQAIQSADQRTPNAVAAALAHVSEVDELAGDGSLRPVVAEWVSTLTPSQRVDIFGRRNVPPVVRLLLSLIVGRRLGSLVILEKLVFPELKHAAGLCTQPDPRLSSKRTYAIDWTVTLTQQLLLCTGHKSLPPQNLREAYIVQTARSSVFHAHHVEGLIQHLPILIVLERSKTVPEKTRSQIRDIVRGLAALPQFKTAAFRNLDVLKDAFLSNDWIKRSNDSALETGMVEGLKLMMSDSVSGMKTSTSFPALESGTRYTAWRATRVVLEMRVEFKRLTMRIANNDDPVEARQQLSRLVRSSLDRDANPDDMDLLMEAFRGADSVVAQEILSVGLDRLGVLLSQLLSAEDQHQVETTELSVNLMLRVMGSVGKQDKIDAPTAVARDRLLGLLGVGFQSLERRVVGEDDVQLLAGAKPAEPGEVLKVALKLLRFALAVPNQEMITPSQPKPDYAGLAVSYLHLAVALCGRAHVFTDLDGMRDLLVYLVDSVPPSLLISVQHALACETSTTPVQDLIAQYPSFASALPRPVSLYRAMALTGSQHLADGEGIPLDDRPWEMLEFMAALPTPPHRDLFLASKPMKDTASIPIALFKPQLTRDAVPYTSTTTDDDRAWEQASAERSLGNGFAGEPIAARQTATILYARRDGSAVEEVKLALPPTPSKVKRLNTRIANAPKGAGTTADPIAIESDSSSSDEEPLAPAAKRPRTGSKTATGSGARQATAGKAPRKAAASTASTTARKATGGKGVRSVSGKDVKRRRSGAE